MKALGRQNYLQTAFSTSPSLFFFLTPSVCCWPFPHHVESSAVTSGWWWDLVLSDPIDQPSSETGACKWHLLPPGLLLLSLVHQPVWPSGSCEILALVVLLWSQLSRKGVFYLEWGWGYYVIAEDYFDWFFSRHIWEDAVNIVRKSIQYWRLHFCSVKWLRTCCQGKHFISQTSLILPRWTGSTFCSSGGAMVLYVLWDSEELF